MPSLEEYRGFGSEIEEYLLLRSSPLAVKMLRSEAEIPEGAIRPKKDRGYHLAQCQAFTISRRRKTAVAMLKEDNWCWGPLLAYGLVEKSVAGNYTELDKDVKNLPCLEHGKYIGIVSAPLSSANFEPDIVVIYSNTAQLNNMLLSLTYYNGEGMVDSPIYPVASCAFSVVPALSGRYCVTLPDPGEYGRALAGEDEMIFSVPREKIEVLVEALRAFEKRKMGYRNNAFTEINADFPRPDFYKRLYRECGLDADDIPTWTP